MSNPLGEALTILGKGLTDMSKRESQTKTLYVPVATGNRGLGSLGKLPATPFDIKHEPHIIGQLKRDGLLPLDYQYKGPPLPFDPSVHDYENETEQPEMPQGPGLPSVPETPLKNEDVPALGQLRQSKIPLGQIQVRRQIMA